MHRVAATVAAMPGARFLHLPALALALATAVTSGGCAGVMFNDRDRLKMALEEYNDGLRWGKVESSVAHLPVAQRQAFAERFSQLHSELEVMDYEVQRIQWDRDHGTATARVEVSWSLKRR